MTDTLETLAQRIAALEARNVALDARIAALEPTPEPAPLPPAMTPADRPMYVEYDQAQGLRDQIAEDEAELVKAIAECELWHSGQHPEFPNGPASNFRPGLLQVPDQLRRNIADRKTRLDQLEGKRRLAPTR